MNRKLIFTCVMLLWGVCEGRAQKVLTDSIVCNQNLLQMNKDSLQMVSAAETGNVTENKEDGYREEVWQRSKYLNLSYGKQSIESDYQKMNSKMAFGVEYGRTYYLHKKPIAGILKFGIDVNFLDLNFAKYPDLPSEVEQEGDFWQENEGEGSVDLGIMQLEAGIGAGPSVTVNPVDHLKACLYFHVTPSYSMMLQNSTLYRHYATFFNVGLTVAYKVISLGIERRWCGKIDYKGLAMDRVEDVYDKDGNFHDPFESVGTLMETDTWRFFIGFRF